MKIRSLSLLVSLFITIWLVIFFFLGKEMSKEIQWYSLLIVFFLPVLFFKLFLSYLLKRFIRNKSSDVRFVDREKDDIECWSNEKLQQIKELRNMEKYRRTFLGDVSHELRTPIFTIQGYISTLLDGGLEDSSINRKYLERTEKSIERMISIVEDLIAISKLESGEIAINKTVFPIQDLILDIIEMQEMRAQKRNVEIVFNSEDSSGIMVYADKKLIYQVLLNLLVNAIIYGKENEKVSLSVLDRDKDILITVADQGEGIAKEHLDKIFNRFYRIDKSRSREYGGTGLGLSICKHIMEAHNQKIEVKSEIGKGSVFSFSLGKIRSSSN